MRHLNLGLFIRLKRNPSGLDGTRLYDSGVYGLHCTPFNLFVETQHAASLRLSPVLNVREIENLRRCMFANDILLHGSYSPFVISREPGNGDREIPMVKL